MLNIIFLSAAKANQVDKKSAVRFDPVIKNIEGWKIHIDPALLKGKHSTDGLHAIKMLTNHLQRISILVQGEALKKLKTCQIWLEHSHPTLHAMQYHPSVGWLKANGHDPRLQKKVHVPQAKALTSRGQLLKHPAVILHELAHAYHDQFLTFEHPEIIAAYNKARQKGDYNKVMLYTGQSVKHYAMTNHKEYFAEGTEAYFYRNDFYPFVRAELKKHDLDLHKVLEKVWGSAQK
ncbi:MAG: metallopeptidase [Verrucomicrobiales bacterium]|nr:metallopeptidase [Verrucomicrobiales bacterium]MBV63627.1 metallopeptidase [Rickettsiales bacterium]